MTRYTFTGPSRLAAGDRELARAAVAALSDGTEFTTGGADGWDMLVAELAVELHPAAHHRVVLPAAPCERERAYALAARHPVEIVQMPIPRGRQVAPKAADLYRARNERLCDFGDVLVAGVRRATFYRSGEWMTIGIALRAGLEARLVGLGGRA